LGRSGVRVITIGLVVLSLWLLASFVSQVITSAQMERRKDDLRAEIARLEAANAALKDQVAFAESPVYAEQAAREQLGYAREGDNVILPTFPQSTAVPAIPAPVTVISPTAEPNWRGWARALFPPADAP
jgi:cell division protein FtsB